MRNWEECFLNYTLRISRNKTRNPFPQRGDPLYIYLQDAQKCISFLCIVCLCKGYAWLYVCLCVWAQRTPLIVYISTSSRILILEYIFGSGFHSSALFSMHALAMHFVSACLCVCCLPAAFFIMQKIAYHFFVVFHFGYFFEMHSTKLHVSLRASFVRTAGIKKRETQRKNAFAIGVDSLGFFIYLDVDAFFGNSQLYLLTWF